MEKQQKFWLIELLAYWEGRVNTSHLNTYLKRSRQQSGKDLKAYRESSPDNLTYCKTKKAYLLNVTFKAQYISGDVEEYLKWVQNPFVIPDCHTPKAQHMSNIAIELPPRKVSPQVMRCLVIAMREQKRVDVDYVSLNNPTGEGRIIAPHSFVNTGLRWHVRAWCEKSSGYRDFVLSRFRGEPELLDKSDKTSADDNAWNTQVTLVLQPDSRLPMDKKAVLENDYQMQNGELRITTKGCLVNYLLREMQISIKMLDGTPEAQQLVLVNSSDIKPWLFDG
jgi:hypothetical protein